MTRPTSRVEALLYELCVTYGYCLPEGKNDELLANPPHDPDEFVDAVLLAEGIDPTLVDKHQRTQVRGVVCDWLFDEGRGRGSKSGLPRVPDRS
jgi:hypothetical protein